MSQNQLGSLYSSRPTGRRIVETNNATFLEAMDSQTEYLEARLRQQQSQDPHTQPDSERTQARPAVYTPSLKRHLIEETRLPAHIRAMLPAAKRGRPSHAWIRAYNKVIDDFRATDQGKKIDLSLPDPEQSQDNHQPDT
jgi:hypothetical protein